MLVCPLCSGQVSTGAASCHDCHLPIADVRSHQPQRRSGAERAARVAQALRVRVFGLLLYAGAVWWSSVQLPTSLTFVVPGALVAGWFHVVRGQPWRGVLAFLLVVGALPLLFWPSMLTDLLGSANG
jgi:hypothetical protein